MTKIGRLTLVGLTLAAIGGLVVYQFGPPDSRAAQPVVPQATTQSSGLPKLMDLGSVMCIPCKMMAPILEGLKEDYAGKFDVEFVDVGLKQNLPMAKTYGITLIPTQIFFDATGKELWRHEGFISKQDILAKWNELKLDFNAAVPATAPTFERMEPAKAADQPPASQPDKTVIKSYPGLASGAFRLARLTGLPKGVLLRTDGLTLSDEDLASEIAKAPQQVQPQLHKNALFLLEQMATRRLLLAQARAIVTKQGKDAAKMPDGELVQAVVEDLSAGIKVTDQEIAEFYKENRDTVGDATLEQIKPQIDRFIRQRKQQETLAGFVETLGSRVVLEVSEPWVKEQAALATDNPVDKARSSGRSSLVDFGSKGCKPCDMLTPILEGLKKKYDGRANVIFIFVNEEQILAARYGIEVIPVQVFFDKDGKEVFRHVGFFPQDQIERKLAEIGVK